MEHKIIFTGPVGAGKTTAISSVSDIMVVATEAKASDAVAKIKTKTTVAMDYGILNLADGNKVHLYGTPGQERFSFMWEILSKNAMGIVILIDNSNPKAYADLKFYLNAFSKPIAQCSEVVAIGVTRTEGNSEGGLPSHFHEHLASLKLNIPIFEVDCRKREDVKQLLMALLAQLDPCTFERQHV